MARRHGLPLTKASLGTTTHAQSVRAKTDVLDRVPPLKEGTWLPGGLHVINMEVDYKEPNHPRGAMICPRLLGIDAGLSSPFIISWLALLSEDSQSV